MKPLLNKEVFIPHIHSNLRRFSISSTHFPRAVHAYEVDLAGPINANKRNHLKLSLLFHTCTVACVRFAVDLAGPLNANKTNHLKTSINSIRTFVASVSPVASWWDGFPLRLYRLRGISWWFCRLRRWWDVSPTGRRSWRRCRLQSPWTLAGRPPGDRIRGTLRHVFELFLAQVT